MTRICYVNGRYVDAAHAAVSMWDRGHQFADGVYEVIAFFGRRFLDEEPHLARLCHSLAALRIASPMSEAALKLAMREVVARNRLEDGSLYLQVTRGAAVRNHPFPKGVRPSLTMAAMPPKQPSPEEVARGVRVISHPDLRWGRCDVKSIALLPNVLARQHALEQGAREVFLVDGGGAVTEGAISTVFIVRSGALLTHPADHRILGGVRRAVVLRLAREHGIPVEERAFSLEEARQADEAFLTSASSHVLPVTMLDGAALGAGVPGPVTLRLLALYRKHVTRQTGKRWA